MLSKEEFKQEQNKIRNSITNRALNTMIISEECTSNIAFENGYSGFAHDYKKEYVVEVFDETTLQITELFRLKGAWVNQISEDVFEVVYDMIEKLDRRIPTTPLDLKSDIIITFKEYIPTTDDSIYNIYKQNKRYMGRVVEIKE